MVYPILTFNYARRIDMAKKVQTNTDLVATQVAYLEQIIDGNHIDERARLIEMAETVIAANKRNNEKVLNLWKKCKHQIGDAELLADCEDIINANDGHGCILISEMLKAKNKTNIEHVRSWANKVREVHMIPNRHNPLTGWEAVKMWFKIKGQQNPDEHTA